MKNALVRIISVILFTLGMLAGLAFFVPATWADVESAFYGFNQYGNALTSKMHCPVLITSTETGVIRMKFKNTSEKKYRPNVTLQVGRAGVFREETIRLDLQPGEQITLEWVVTPDDMTFGRFIFVKMATYASYPLPDLEQSCGILVLDLPGFSGGQAAAGFITLCLAGMGLGCLLWARSERTLKARPLEILRAMITLAVVIGLGLVSVLFAIWPAGVLLAALALILVGVIIANFVNYEKV